MGERPESKNNQGVAGLKKIHLIRHAKSSWANEGIADIDRPLNEVGVASCALMAAHLDAAGCCFDNVFCSPATRAQATISLIANNLPDKNIVWETEDELYSFDSASIIGFIKNLDESVSEVLVIGHNPALTDFCNAVSDSKIKNIPTCGYVQLATDQDCLWRHITANSFELIDFIKPKALKSK